MDIKIDFFKENLIDAIGAGVYRVSVSNENQKTETLYIGESEFVLVRCASHLYELKKNPNYWGFTDETINNPNVKLIFSIIELENDKIIRKKSEKEYIHDEEPISQSGISDKLKAVEDRKSSLNEFLGYYK